MSSDIGQLTPGIADGGDANGGQSLRSLLLINSVWLVSRLLLAAGLVIIAAYVQNPLEKFISRVQAGNISGIERDRLVAQLDKMKELVEAAEKVELRIGDAQLISKISLSGKRDSLVRLARSKLEELEALYFNRNMQLPDGFERTSVIFLVDCDKALSLMEQPRTNHFRYSDAKTSTLAAIKAVEGSFEALRGHEQSYRKKIAEK